MKGRTGKGRTTMKLCLQAVMMGVQMTGTLLTSLPPQKLPTLQQLAGEAVSPQNDPESRPLLHSSLHHRLPNSSR